MSTAAADEARTSSSRQRVSLSARIAFMLGAVLLFTLGLLLFLNYSNFRKSYFELNQSRYLVLAKDVKQAAEAGLNVGLAIETNARLQSTLRDIKARQAKLGEETGNQSNIEFALIFNDNGNVVHTSNRELQNTRIEDAWLTQHKKTGFDKFWQAQTGRAFLIGLPVVNDFNVAVGGVVIAFEKGPIEAKAEQVLTALAKNLAITLLVFVILGYLGVSYLTRPLTRSVAEIEDDMERFMTQPNKQNATPDDESLLGQDVAVFQHRALEAMEAIDRVEKALSQAELAKE